MDGVRVQARRGRFQRLTRPSPRSVRRFRASSSVSVSVVVLVKRGRPHRVVVQPARQAMFHKRSSTLLALVLALLAALGSGSASRSTRALFLAMPCRPAWHRRGLLHAAAAGDEGGQGSTEPMRPLLAEGIDLRQVDAPAAGRLLVAKPWEYNHFTSKVRLSW